MKRQLDQEIENATEQAVKRIRQFLAKESPTSSEVAAARIATSTLASYARVRQADGAREAMVAMMARELSEDRPHLRRLLRIGSVEDSPLRALAEAPELPPKKGAATA